MMGSPAGEEGRHNDERQHTVSVGGVWLGKYEVTNAQNRRFKAGHDRGELAGNSLNCDSIR